MRFNLQSQLRCAGVLFTLSQFPLCGSGRADGQESAPPDTLKIEYFRGPGAPMSIPGYENYHAYLVDSVDLKGKRRERQVRVSSPRHGAIAFPALRKGEIIPLFGALYRVKSDAPLEVVRLKAEDAPKGIAVERDSVTIPLMRDGAGSGQVVYQNARFETEWRTVFVTSIGTPDKGAGPVAQVKIEDIRKEAQAIRKGDVLKLGASEWTVRAVIPPGGERQLFGWVELGPRTKGADR